MTLKEIARVVGGDLTDVPDPDTIVDQPAAYDSHQVTPGGLPQAEPTPEGASTP
ncbi:hypothetical protein [Streptomyces sp. NPDC052042]|uniref:hypothetical protein n=1 Tax=Streptomyces sp. NPDC052042 TaxID=3365683 RepID=UPI0037CFEA89